MRDGFGPESLLPSTRVKANQALRRRRFYSCGTFLPTQKLVDASGVLDASVYSVVAAFLRP
jgi:hypothetical protein